MTWPQLNADHAIVTAEQMTFFENQILSSGLPEEALMEKVGQAMTRWLLQHQSLIERGVIVLVGPGHNGGDGLVIARELHLAGVGVSFWCPFPLKKKLTINQFEHAKWLGVKELETIPNILDESIWLDAVFGLGQQRELPIELADLFRSRQTNLPGKLISIDVPSGICSDFGKPFKTGAAYASFTLVVGLFKRGLIQDYAIPYVGNLVRFDIGILEKRLIKLSSEIPLRISSSDLTSFDWPELSSKASKYERGRVLIISGSEKYKGAAYLSIRGALSSGTGSLQVAIPKSLADFVPQYAPEVVLAGLLEHSPDQSVLIGEFLKEKNLNRIDSLLIGPGLGVSDESWEHFSLKLKEFSGLLVLDADALNRLAISREGWEWLKGREGRTIITPHLKEFRRLFKTLDCSDPLNAAKQAAEMSGAGVLLKCAHSVFATPSGRLWQLGDSAPWVARTGLGDVLAGFLAGVGAMGVASMKGPEWDLFAASALIHSEAARNCPSGSTASEIATFLGTFVRRINYEKYLEKNI
tara:strand:- start:1981 stop:3555 length:1575 start_codon:yes stop_codon:yes gene_type:complete